MQPSMSSPGKLSSTVPGHIAGDLSGAMERLCAEQAALYTDSLLCAGEVIEQFPPALIPLILSENATTWLNSGGGKSENQRQTPGGNPSRVMTPSTPATQLACSDKFTPSGDAGRNRYNRLVALVPLTGDEELAKMP